MNYDVFRRSPIPYGKTAMDASQDRPDQSKIDRRSAKPAWYAVNLAAMGRSPNGPFEVCAHGVSNAKRPGFEINPTGFSEAS